MARLDPFVIVVVVVTRHEIVKVHHHDIAHKDIVPAVLIGFQQKPMMVFQRAVMALEPLWLAVGHNVVKDQSRRISNVVVVVVIVIVIVMVPCRCCSCWWCHIF